MFDLKKLRTKILVDRNGQPLFTQKELAEAIGETQDKISKWEAKSDSMPLSVFLTLCKKLGVKPEQLMTNNSLRLETERANFGRPYHERDIRVEFLNEYCKNSPVFSNYGEEFSVSIPSQAQELVELLNKLRKDLKNKPLIAVIGKFNVGKSRLLNSLLGINDLPTDWEPTTMVPIYIKSMDDRPYFIHDEVCIFKAGENDETEWDHRLYHDKEYHDKWSLKSGGPEILERYTTHQGRGDQNKSPAGAVLMFVDAPLLNSCDLVDLPGFGNPDPVEDDKMATAINNIADGFIYLSFANAFIDNTDVIHLQSLLRQTYIYIGNENKPKPFGNLIVVASQAHIIESEKLDSMVQNRAKKIYKSFMPNSITEYFREKGIKYTENEFLKRFVPYSLDKPELQRKFREKLRHLLEDDLSGQFTRAQEDLIREFREIAEERLQKEIEGIDLIKHHRKEVADELRKVKKTRDEKKLQLAMKRDLIKDLVDEIKISSVALFKEESRKIITEANVKSVMKAKGYDKASEAQKSIVNNMVENVQDAAKKILDKKMNDLKPKLDEFYQEYEELANTISVGLDLKTVTPFDFQGALAASLAAAGALGALSIYAAGFGSLGWYIVAAKGVSILSTLGIGLGGVAPVMTFLAAIGGPITVATGLAIVLGVVTKQIFGKTWKDRLAKQVVKLLKKEELVEKISQQVEVFWDNTTRAFVTVANGLSKRIDDYISEMEEVLSKDDPDQLEQDKGILKQLQEFFAGIPWVEIPKQKVGR